MPDVKWKSRRTADGHPYLCLREAKVGGNDGPGATRYMLVRCLVKFTDPVLEYETDTGWWPADGSADQTLSMKLLPEYDRRYADAVEERRARQDWDWVTNDMFDTELAKLLEEEYGPVRALHEFEGWAGAREKLNNEVLARLAREYDRDEATGHPLEQGVEALAAELLNDPPTGRDRH
jgi:hypothetical protein